MDGIIFFSYWARLNLTLSVRNSGLNDSIKLLSRENPQLCVLSNKSWYVPRITSMVTQWCCLVAQVRKCYFPVSCRGSKLAIAAVL